MHRSFAAAGADVVETNTFGANRISLDEYGLGDRVASINQAAVAHARTALRDWPGKWIWGSVGPGARLPLLGQIRPDELAQAYREQIVALVDAGVDGLILETCQDLLQIKTALTTCRDVLARGGHSLPVMVSVTMEPGGTLLTGSDMSAIVATLEPFDLFSLGLNCATGPAEMAPHVQYLHRHWRGRISLMPNAGLPRIHNGATTYPLEPEPFAQAMAGYIRKYGVSIAGGCCGTTPEHIRALCRWVRPETSAESPERGDKPASATTAEVRPDRVSEFFPALSSVYSAMPLRPEIPPFLVGERLNATGSKAFRKCLLENDTEGILRIALRQQQQGAMALDLSTAYAGRDESTDLCNLVCLLRTAVKIPLMIDSTNPQVIEAALKLHPGRCIVNSINLEDGGATLDAICSLARRHGAAVVALTIDEQGMAMTIGDKMAVAHAIYDRAVHHHGLRPSDLLFDLLTFTIGSGDDSLRRAAIETLGGIQRIKHELPGVGTVLGVSNISFGLAPAARKVLNSVFLHEAVKAGLDAAIVDVAKILPLHGIPSEDRRICLDLIYDKQAQPETDDPSSGPLQVFIRHFAGQAASSGTPADNSSKSSQPFEQRLTASIVDGDANEIEDLLDTLLRRYTADAIVNVILIPAMRQVGRLFGEGELLLPFVLQSAETMKRAVKHLEPHLKNDRHAAGPGVLLATVQGDVHDIGKNLVGIILSNNGYQIHDLGTKVPAGTIIEKARELQPQAIGLSGLLVKSALLMRENLEAFGDAGLRQPVLLGGAALTADFVARECAPRYPAPVVYCADAFDGLRALREHRQGTLRSTSIKKSSRAEGGGKRSELQAPVRNQPTPKVPFTGRRHITDITLEDLRPYINEQALFRGRWGYRRGKMDPADYERLLEREVRPRYAEILRRVRAESLLQPGVAYGYFQAVSEGDALRIEHEARTWRFEFPRQSFAPHLCIADYFKSDGEGGDIAAFFVVTIGHAFRHAIEQLRQADRYRDYLLLHGFSVELTEALAEYWHHRMRIEMGIEPPPSPGTPRQRSYRGARYGFGYPACPELEAQAELFDLLHPEKLGMTLTESMQIVPEQSTSAIVVHHPEACYFSL